MANGHYFVLPTALFSRKKLFRPKWINHISINLEIIWLLLFLNISRQKAASRQWFINRISLAWEHWKASILQGVKNHLDHVWRKFTSLHRFSLNADLNFRHIYVQNMYNVHAIIIDGWTGDVFNKEHVEIDYVLCL